MGAVIYALRCPVTGDVRYIGKANDAAKRLQTHIRDSRGSSRPVCKWIKSLTQRNLIPLIETIASAIDGKWEDLERIVIAQYRADTPRLLNVADGGANPKPNRESLARGGVTAAQARTATPKAKAMYEAKRDVGRTLSWLKKNAPDGYERVMVDIRRHAIEFPQHFSQWL